jgi:hypothetical protein
MSLRITYAANARPKLTVAAIECEVADISEMGLRFFHDIDVEVGQQISGILTLLCGEAMNVEGMVVRKDLVHYYMNARKPIPRRILEQERQHIDLDTRL